MDFIDNEFDRIRGGFFNSEMYPIYEQLEEFYFLPMWSIMISYANLLRLNRVECGLNSAQELMQVLSEKVNLLAELITNHLGMNPIWSDRQKSEANGLLAAHLQKLRDSLIIRSKNF